MMEKYVTYRCADFASDQAFIDWVRNPGPESDVFWTALAALYPALKGEIDDARLIVQSMEFVEPELTAGEIYKLWQGIETDTRKKKTPVLRYLSICAACAASVAVLFGIWRWMNNSTASGEMDKLTEFAAKSASVVVIGSEVQVTLADQSNYAVATDHAELQYDEKGQIIVNAKDVINQQVKDDKTVKDVIFNQVMVPWGKRTTISFADGTKLWLNAGSRAVYPVEFAGNKREIFIEGEAYLEVTKDESRPFFVKTGTIEVRVLGTSFNVNAYPQENKTEVALVSGSVQVTGNNMQTLQLQPDCVVEIDNVTMQQVVKLVDIYDYISWKDGFLQFNSENLEVVLRCLERHYAIPIVIETPLDKYIISGKLDLKEKLEGPLKIIEKLAPIQYKFENNKVFIYKK